MGQYGRMAEASGAEAHTRLPQTSGPGTAFLRAIPPGDWPESPLDAVRRPGPALSVDSELCRSPVSRGPDGTPAVQIR